MKTSLKVTAVA